MRPSELAVGPCLDDGMEKVLLLYWMDLRAPQVVARLRSRVELMEKFQSQEMTS